MPAFLESKLRKEAAKKGFKGKRADRYVYGAMNNMGAMRGNKETKKGAAMEKKHKRDHGGKVRRGIPAGGVPGSMDPVVAGSGGAMYGGKVSAGDNSRGYHHPMAHAKSMGKGRW